MRAKQSVLSLKHLVLGVSAIALLPICMVAAAQEQADDASETDEVRRLGAVEVTARRRAESVQDIPLSVTSIDAINLERGGIESLEDIANFTPGLTYQEFNGGGLGAPVIRGLAQTDVASFDNNVGTFLDGVFLSAKANLDVSLLGIQRVEVTRGPQSALYGNNSFSGAVNFVTQDPRIASKQLTATAGSDERFDISASIAGELVENVLYGRVSAGYSTFDGTIENSLTSENLGGFDDKFAASASLTWTPIEAFDATAFIYYSDEDIDPSAGFIETNNCGGPNSLASDIITGRGGSISRFFCGTPDIPDEVNVFPQAFSERDSLLAYVKLNYDFGGIVLRSTTSYGDYSADALSDQSLTPSADIDADFAARNFIVPFIGDTDDFSQEIRLESFDNGPFDWTLGAYYIDRDVDEFFQTFTGAALDGTSVLGLDRFQTLSSEAFSIFGLLGYSVTDKLKVSGELRQTWDERDFESTLAFPIFGVPPATQNENDTFKFLTFRATADYQLSADTLLYASAASGAKSGGFNASADVTETSFGEETNITYEAGFKQQFFGGNAYLNAAVFFTTWDDLQIPVPSSIAGNANVTQNFGDASAFGIEFDGAINLTENTQVNFGYAYSDATFDSGTEDVSSGFRCATPADCGPVGPTGGIDVSGNRLPRSAEHQFNASATQFFPTRIGEFYLRGDLSYQSERFSTPLNLQDDDGRTLVNARFGVTLGNGIDLSVWSNNLFNEDFVNSTINEPEFFPLSTFSTAFVANTRTFGATLRISR